MGRRLESFAPVWGSERNGKVENGQKFAAHLRKSPRHRSAQATRLFLPSARFLAGKKRRHREKRTKEFETVFSFFAFSFLRVQWRQDKLRQSEKLKKLGFQMLRQCRSFTCHYYFLIQFLSEEGRRTKSKSISFCKKEKKEKRPFKSIFIFKEYIQMGRTNFSMMHFQIRIVQTKGKI